MSGKKLNKEILDKVREIDGFPVGKDKDIISLSVPPFFTSCPNPWIEDFIKENGKIYDPKNDDYHREPFTSDVSEGKNDPIYNAQSYHTKVPPKAIFPYILHYTNPGDVIYDGFCGTGMTGVAAQMCNNPLFSSQIIKKDDSVKLGARNTILCDISPAASSIAYNLNSPLDKKIFDSLSGSLLDEVTQKNDWMFQTKHKPIDSELSEESSKFMGLINYTVWCDVVSCPNCSTELLLWDVAVSENEIFDEFNCTNCKILIYKKKVPKVTISIYDSVLDTIVKVPKQKPVLVFYKIEKEKTFKRFTKIPDNYDNEILNKINDVKITKFFPSDLMMFKEGKWGDTWRQGVHTGITHTHHFYTKRNLIWLSHLYDLIQNLDDAKKRSAMLNLFMSFNPGFVSKLTRYNFGKRGNSPMMGVIYPASYQVERNPSGVFSSKLKDLRKICELVQNNLIIISTQSSTQIPQIPNNSIDYIFTDPPFGKNLMYSELNFIWESWLKVFTNNKKEAIINNSQKKGLVEYQELMEQCFKENYRILKPNRWMTIVFHNSQPSVWTAIQEALQRVGFVVADVRTLDKKQGTIKQITASRAVKQDLVISTYKPSGGLDKFFGGLSTGNEEGVWKFLDTHLKQLPIFVKKNETVEIIVERQKFLLYDRMIAFHVQKGLTISISASEFYEKLNQKYPERDGMYFLSEQIPEYAQKRAKIKSIEKTTIYVEDEKSTILWLNEQLKIPQTYQEIQPKFLREIHKSKYEKLPELSEILEQNFLQDNKDKWYVPDHSQLKDLEKLREKSLIREYQTYQESKGKLKQFRLEAIRVGFKKKWSENNYKSIIDIAKKLPEEIIQEDSNLLMYYDNSISRI